MKESKNLGREKKFSFFPFFSYAINSKARENSLYDFQNLSPRIALKGGQ